MILTINVNAAIDSVYLIDRFVPETHMRAQKSMVSIGGKGLTTAVVLKTLGAPVQAISFIAGVNGKTLADLLARKEIETRLLWLPGETRTANVIVETEIGRHSHITTQGYNVTQENCQDFLAALTELAPGIKWAVIAGSIPPGAQSNLYQEIVELLNQHNIKTLIDTTGQPMREALLAFPEIVKMNRAEFQDTFDVTTPDLQELIQHSLLVIRKHQIKSLVLTLGREGILAFTDEGIFQAECDAMQEVSAAGAGDSVSAAIVYRLSLGETWQQALQWAVATSAAVVLTEGTAECHMSDVMDIYPRSRVKKIVSSQ